MAATTDMPTSLPTPPSPSPPSSSFSFPRPYSPTKDVKPNTHPYPIKTTSTALLSRSNSVSASPATRHHYVPPPPPSPSPNAKESGGRRGEYRGHRYSRSLSSSEDMYLPNNANSGVGSGGTNGNAVQGPRALPVPPGVSNNSIASMGMSANAAALAGTSPKRWTPAQLAAHLGASVSHEAGEWAARRGVGGRAFMRMAEEEMAAMGASLVPPFIFSPILPFSPVQPAFQFPILPPLPIFSSPAPSPFPPPPHFFHYMHSYIYPLPDSSMACISSAVPPYIFSPPRFLSGPFSFTPPPFPFPDSY
ncbi:hypothetical protein DFH07DRAFT_144015 [Mycena maculata]|uniref:Uncharacterized protein n=1 Tax=Mycena maculata TaxID=230809 RepID=A0AAD7I0D6_9AGAR|nr:hypothetical protein DFH07DRAFT_144015 [Mycena maculata]